jgi:CBS-domain-containing membrane protein
MLAMDIMTRDVVMVSPEMDVHDVARLMLNRRVSAVLVIDDDGRLSGIVSEGDLMRRTEARTERHASWWLSFFADSQEASREYVKSHGRHVRDVMTEKVVTVSEDTPISEIAAILESHHIKRVPVMAQDKVVGIVSRANLLQALAARKIREVGAESDRDLRTAILDALRDADVATNYVNVLVDDGTVQLWGGVWTEDEKRAIQIAAENVPGVKTVENHVAVLPPIVMASGWV